MPAPPSATGGISSLWQGNFTGKLLDEELGRHLPPRCRAIWAWFSVEGLAERTDALVEASLSGNTWTPAPTPAGAPRAKAAAAQA